jgi:hypothetical protein
MNDTTVITALESRLVAITTMQANREFVAELAGHEARINATIKSLNLKRDDCAKAVAPIIILRARAEAQLQRLIEAAREAGEFAQSACPSARRIAPVCLLAPRPATRPPSPRRRKRSSPAGARRRWRR